ncbi:DUF3289 family protein [Flavobacterium jejuense]|uniref:DUF3289 family protein n=1 Tax=Flavobacterium jejuense TaxID=1544455 RepID=A0ABX0J041_9FLAO|nr:DUF3289 family protein [Flavobacterium jejuense]NHN28153.1 DUF3289 family protein [Flavobacterium jejuense]
MTRTRIVGGKLIETTGGDYNIYTKENIVYSAATTITETGVETGVSYGDPQSPPARNEYFVKGWWSLDIEGNKVITNALPSMLVYFHLETKNIDNGNSILITLYEEDNSEPEETSNQDDKITLINSATRIETIDSKVNNNKVVIPLELSKLDNFIEDEVDKVLELYFKCTYLNESAKFPSAVDDYLKVGQIIADRYKIPGLNENGSDIASDLCYGFGVKDPLPIYPTNTVTTYKSEYENSGFIENVHNLFINKSNESHKALYSKEECYSTKYTLTTIPLIDLDINIATGLDVRVFDTLSDETLFWDFQATASLYFARGVLQGNLERMIAKFKANEGGIYEDEVLTEAIKNSTVTQKYCVDVEKYLSEKIKGNILSLDKLEDKTPYLGSFQKIRDDRSQKNKNFSRPIYNENKTEGLTIALNDIWATQVLIKELKNTGNNYTCKYEVILWDHFGLDLPDMEKVFNIIPSVGETFVTWFILQHLRGYKPFVTKIKFEKEFNGTF